MKKNYSLQTLTISFLIAITVFISFAFLYPGGSPGGYTNSPGDKKNCTSCHNGTLMTIQGNGWVSSDIPSAGYTPGSIYNMTVSVPGSGTKGFEVSPQTLAGAVVGSLTAGSGSKLSNSNKSVTQTSGSNSNPAVWKFKWTAPAKNTGPVTFYGAFAVGKQSTYVGVNVFPENIETNIPEISKTNIDDFKIYPNPVKDRFTILSYSDDNSQLRAEIIDNCGKLIRILETENLFPGSNYFSYNIDNSIREGVYLLRITNSKGVSLKKFMKL